MGRGDRPYLVMRALVVASVSLCARGALAQHKVDMPQTAIEAPDTSLVARELSFIGFTPNETLCAWRQTLHRPHGTVVDTASTAIVVQMANHHVLAVYKQGVPSRASRRGHYVHASPTTLLLRQPEYQRAMSQAAWAHLQRRAHFSAIQSQYVTPTIRLAPDDDVTLHVKPAGKQLDVAAEAKSPMGFGVIGRLLDGSLVTFGHFRLPEGLVGHKAQVRTYFSHTGHSVAVIVHFLGDDVPLEAAYQTALGQTPGSPLADLHIGVTNRTQEEDQDLRDIFKQMHPEGAADWDAHIGKLF